MALRVYIYVCGYVYECCAVGCESEIILICRIKGGLVWYTYET